MSLFPAYGPSGSGRRGGGKDNTPRNSSSKNTRDKDDDIVFVFEGNEGAKQAHGSDCHGTSSDPIVIGGDDGEEGEIRSPAQTPPPPQDDDHSRGKHKKKHSSSKKRKQSKSPSHSPKHKKKKRKQSPSPSPPPVRRERSQQQQFEVTGVNYQNNNQRSRGYDQQRAGNSSGSRSGGYDMGRNFNDSHKNVPDSDRRYGNNNYNTNYGRQYPYVESVPSRTNAREYESRQTNYDGRSKQNQQAIPGERRAYYEEQRVNVAQRFPNKVFLEEVNLRPEFAFRVDKGAQTRNLNSYTLGSMQKSAFHYNNSIKVMGASDQELTQIYSKFSKFRCVLPDGLDESEQTMTNKKSSSIDNNVQPSSSRPKPAVETQTFISTNKPKSKQRHSDDSIDIQYAFDSGNRKEGEPSMKESIESYNKRLRDEPKNIALWKEFITFQDKYFQENEKVYGDDASSKKKRRNKKALLEKKVAICEKALESNPRNVELNLLKLNFLSAFKPPEDVLSQWKTLATKNSKVTPYWIEYLRFLSTQLQVYSTHVVVESIQKSVKKFRQMLSSSFPEFQRPDKFFLVVNDILMCVSLILRNSGHRERAIALHQAQLEFDFYPCLDQLNQDFHVDWSASKKMFDLFWDIGTPVFGEKNAIGWCNYIQDVDKQAEQQVVGVSDEQVSKTEDVFFQTVNTLRNASEPIDKSKQWLLMELWRGKLQWLHWRSKCSDVTDVDDDVRIVLGQDVSPFVVTIPKEIPELERQAAYFRHVVNFLVTIQEDFLPQTHTVSSLVNPVTSVSLTESRSFVSELFYWRKMLNLYVPESESIELSDLKSLVKIPEAFRIKDWTSQNGSAHKCEVGMKPDPFELPCPKRIESTKNAMLAENEQNLLIMLRSIIDKGTDFLNPAFSTLLFEMYLRFEQKNTMGYLEQKNTVGAGESHKVRIEEVKRLFQKNCLRNSMGGYLEISMLEYFNGNKEDAITILVKTINLGYKLLPVDKSCPGSVDIENNWALVTELTRLYTRLAEFHFKDEPQIAYNILALLGAGFKKVNLKDCQEPPSSKVVMLKALRNFEKVLAQIIPGIDINEDNDAVVITLSKEFLGRWDGDKCVEYFAQKPNIIVEWTRAFAMFQFLAKKENNFAAACSIYEKVLKRIEITEPLSENGNYDSDNVIRHHITEQLYIHWCNLGGHVLIKDPMANSKFRSILGKALQQFPSSPPLLLLFTDVENQMSIAGKLWRMMVGIVKQDGGCNHWAPLFMGMGLAKRIEDLKHDEEIGLSSFGLGGPAVPPDTIFYKLDSLLCAAQENRMTRNCPLVWRVHLKLLALRSINGKDTERAKSTFYEAVRHCPSAKPIYLDGVSYFPELLKEITDLMTEKNVHIRMPIAELNVLLELEKEAAHKKV